MNPERLGAKEYDDTLMTVLDFRKELETIYGEKAVEIFDEEICYLNQNTSEALKINDKSERIPYNKDELQQLYDQDPGYISDHVMRKLTPKSSREAWTPELDSDSIYLKTGIHRGVIDWHDDAEPGTQIIRQLMPGERVERWGSEEGYYLAEAGTHFDALQLPVSKDKLEHSVYEVIQPFSVEESKIKLQSFEDIPWSGKQGTQYKTIDSISQLLQSGFLRKVALPTSNESKADTYIEKTKQEESIMRMDGLDDKEERNEALEDHNLETDERLESSEESKETEEQKGMFAKVFERLRGKETQEEEKTDNKTFQESEQKELSARDKFLASLKVDVDGPPPKFEKSENKPSETDDDPDKGQRERVRELER